jgi:hypothetical protein
VPDGVRQTVISFCFALRFHLSGTNPTAKKSQMLSSVRYRTPSRARPVSDPPSRPPSLSPARPPLPPSPPPRPTALSLGRPGPTARLSILPPPSIPASRTRPSPPSSLRNRRRPRHLLSTAPKLPIPLSLSRAPHRRRQCRLSRSPSISLPELSPPEVRIGIGCPRPPLSVPPLPVRRRSREGRRPPPAGRPCPPPSSVCVEGKKEVMDSIV